LDRIQNWNRDWKLNYQIWNRIAITCALRPASSLQGSRRSRVCSHCTRKNQWMESFGTLLKDTMISDARGGFLSVLNPRNAWNLMRTICLISRAIRCFARRINRVSGSVGISEDVVSARHTLYNPIFEGQSSEIVDSWGVRGQRELDRTWPADQYQSVKRGFRFSLVWCGKPG
jgi:hypothetical protein